MPTQRTIYLQKAERLALELAPDPSDNEQFVRIRNAAMAQAEKGMKNKCSVADIVERMKIAAQAEVVAITKGRINDRLGNGGEDPGDRPRA